MARCARRSRSRPGPLSSSLTSLDRGLTRPCTGCIEPGRCSVSKTAWPSTSEAFPLELINEQATPKRILDAEIPVVGGLEPDAGWQVWQRHPSEWPVTTLPALEAVEAAKEQGLSASEALDRALRVALFAQSRTISMRHEILEIAEDCEGVDADALKDALVEGRARPVVERNLELSTSGSIKGSPHLFLPDGTDVHNPGIEHHWEGEAGEGFPSVDEDRPEVYEELLRRAAASCT